MGIKHNFFIFLFIVFSTTLFAQNGYVRHTVKAGETVYTIAKIYNISEADLLKYNPDVAGGLKEGTVLILPENMPKKEASQSQKGDFIYHTVVAKETMYGLCKKYNCSEQQILDLNPEIKDGLKEGAVILIPKLKAVEAQKEDSTKYEYHVVEPKETVYSICKAAGISEAEFLALNPQVQETGLQIGQTIKLPKERVREELPTDQPRKKEFGLYRVLEGDDLATIAGKYNTTVEELIKLNPELLEGLVVGKYIVVPAKKPIAKGVATPASLNDLFWYLPSADQKAKVHFALILPFYLEQNDSIHGANFGSAKVFEKSKVALQFLNGFMTAMDTLGKLGYEITLDIYDSQNNVDVVRSIARKIDRSVDAIIGPLYAKNAELLASILPDILIISPLSKTLENAKTPNLINCVPDLKSEFLAISRIIQDEKNSNIIFLNSNKKASKEAVKSIYNMLSSEDSARCKEVWIDGQFSIANHLTPNMAKGKTNILVVVDQNPAFISDLFTKLKNHKDSGLLIVTTSKIHEINTLENRYLNNQNFIGLSPDYVNYADSTTQMFIEQFREKTATEPNKYGFSGFDTGLYFAQLIAANGGKPALQKWPVLRGINKGFYFSAATGAGARNNFVYKLRVLDFELLETKQ